MSEKSDLRSKQFRAALAALAVGGVGGVALGGLRELLTGFDTSEGKNNDDEVTKEISNPGLSAGIPTLETRGQYKFSDDGTKSIQSSGYTIPLLIAAGTAGGSAGFYGVKALANKYRNWRAASEMEGAEKEYEELLKVRYGLAKSSALIEEIEDSCDKLEKRGLDYTQLNGLAENALGVGAGTALAAGGGLWLLSHMASKAHYDKQDDNRNKRKLVEMRIQAQRAKAVTPVHMQLNTAEVNKEEEAKLMEALQARMKQSSAGLSGLSELSKQMPMLNQTQMNKFNTKMVSSAQEAAGDKETGHAITAGFTANAESAKQGIEEALNPAVSSYLDNSFLGSVFGK